LVIFCIAGDIYAVDESGALRVRRTIDAGYGDLIYPALAADGTVYVVSFEGWSYICAINTARDRQDVLLASCATIISMLGTAVLGAVVAAGAVLRRGKSSIEEDGASIRSVSIVVRLAGFSMALISLFLIWQNFEVGGTRFYLESEYQTFYWLVKSDLEMISSLGAVPFIMGTMLVPLTRYASYLQMLGLIVLGITITGTISSTWIPFVGELWRGLPFGTGYTLAWVSAFVMLGSYFLPGRKNLLPKGFFRTTGDVPPPWMSRRT